MKVVVAYASGHGGMAGVAERVRRRRVVLGRRPVLAGDFGDLFAIGALGRGHRM